MKIVPFPAGGDATDAAVIAELEAALAGADGPGSEAWRELREDVRMLAPPIDPGFERTLDGRLSATESAGEEGSQRPVTRARLRLRSWWTGHTVGPRMLATGGAGLLLALLIAIVVVGPLKAGTDREFAAKSSSHPASQTFPESSRLTKPDEQGPAAESSAAAPPTVAAGPSLPAGSSPGRVEQLAASLTLGTSAGEVQQLSDGIGRVATGEGGYVANSQVQVESGGASGATLTLSVPSTRLGRTLSALGHLGSVRAETQSQQDITDAYGAAKRALGDAVAERAALLRALGVATTQSEIESLHRRLALSGAAIERARTAFGRISREASNSTVEVTVVGDAHAGSGLTLHSGLDDAGRVLTVALVVLLIALAALVPIALVALALGLGGRALARSRRERTLRGG
jgi:Domain of unknown function (DUF4349)